MQTSQNNRPKFQPSPCGARDVSDSLISVASESAETPAWVPLIHCPADFPPELFEVAISQLVHHPEYNSTLILRSEIVSDTTSDFPLHTPSLRNASPMRCIHRKLLPRRPGRDSGLEQYCTFFTDLSTDDEAIAHEQIAIVLVLTPIVQEGIPLPYYHPAVSHLAFRYLHHASDPQLRIEVVPLPQTPTDINSRLYRTCLALLEALHRYGWGAMTNYKKRVIHDCIVAREPYQDLYLVMRERHKHLIHTWQESTDPLKHVFEDIGIAIYLMLLWKDMYHSSSSADDVLVQGEDYTNELWKQWPQPPSGFLDLGCGNGLLTHILTQEGYQGHGVDLRRRTSWSHYPESTQAHLHELAIDPTAKDPISPSPIQSGFLPPGVFIIGNHADELTPWVPVLSTLFSASGYLSIPCCAWSFDTKYERSSTPMFPTPAPISEFAETLNLGGDGSHTSSYSMYRIWLSSLSLYCGWRLDCENLRIPSTRNWALIGRSNTWQDSLEQNEVVQRVESIIEGVKERGMFKTRRPEGKGSDH